MFSAVAVNRSRDVLVSFMVQVGKLCSVLLRRPGHARTRC